MPDSSAIFLLDPDEVQADALMAYAARYAEAANWVMGQIIESPVTDQVRLHRLYYRRLRDDYGLPAQSAVLCLKDVAARCRHGRETAPLSFLGPVPYDRHLHSLRAVDRLSLATLTGRVVVPCALSHYGSVPATVARGRLVFEHGDWIFSIRADLTEATLQHAERRKEPSMSDKLLYRISKLIAGVAHSAVSQAEDAAAIPVMEQALRDIDEAVKDLRTEIGKCEANKFNLERRLTELEAEHRGLAGQVDAALAEGKEDLAEAGVGRQVDIEDQGVVLKRAVEDVEADVAKLNESLTALQASRREARNRLRDLKAVAPATGATPAGRSKRGSAATKAVEAIERAERLGEDLTGVPAEANKVSSKDLESLAELHRKNLIQERLAARKARLKSSD